MRVLQILAGLAMFSFPYVLVYSSVGLKENFNNWSIFNVTFGYFLASHAAKVLIMVSGIPELFVRLFIPEKFVLSLLNTVAAAGIYFALQSKSISSANNEHKILGIGIFWSLLDHIIPFFHETLRVFKSLDYSYKFYYFALQANFSVIGYISLTCITLMYIKGKPCVHLLYILFGAYVAIFPILTGFATADGLLVPLGNIIVFAVQAVLGVAFGYAVKHFYKKSLVKA
ncbi:uncharacterized protein BEWA_046760 [Theileria equi strain WA]|uniref:BOS complex subunit TMEM147 n=1 Tax=Theileria equi strain WA TaxID=1537102 RepID=L1L9V6_THEEQ|nr:uncharacterized protein BEWA_046760 [Theileria equi strain WA]EKX72212.1 membrane protein, putative [Theileria equi strain WA]|eukprot:XP_004831664.1 uncharacterized protein BEWA_046760 [Theileria equi strain WA]